MEEVSNTSTEISDHRSDIIADHEALASTSTEIEVFSESCDSLDNLLEAMDAQISDLQQIVKEQKEEIEELKLKIENLKSIISSHLHEHISKIIDYI